MPFSPTFQEPLVAAVSPTWMNPHTYPESSPNLRCSNVCGLISFRFRLQSFLKPCSNFYGIILQFRQVSSVRGHRSSSEPGWDWLSILRLPVCLLSWRVKKCRWILYLIYTWLPWQVTLKSSGTSKRAESEQYSVKHASKAYEGSLTSANCIFIWLFPHLAHDSPHAFSSKEQVTASRVEWETRAIIQKRPPLVQQEQHTHVHSTGCFLPSPCLLCRLCGTRELRAAAELQGFAAFVDI